MGIVSLWDVIGLGEYQHCRLSTWVTLTVPITPTCFASHTDYTSHRLHNEPRCQQWWAGYREILGGCGYLRLRRGLQLRLLFVPSYRSRPTAFVVLGSGCVQDCPNGRGLGSVSRSLRCSV